MTGYKIVNLLDLFSELGEDRANSIISGFSCPLNADVEYFLRNKAFDFSKIGWAATHLVFCSFKNQPVLLGYFTITNKYVRVDDSLLSKTMRKRIHHFAKEVVEGHSILVAPLIAQLGKNYAGGMDALIEGDELLKMALDQIKLLQDIMGGKFVYLECEDTPHLIDFYSRNGFVEMGKRDLEKDEKSLLKGDYLIQLLKYVK